MRRRFSALVLFAMIGLLPIASPPAWAQQSAGSAAGPQATNGTAGRIAKFVTTTELSNSIMVEKGNRIGIGTTLPTSALDIRAQNALQLWAVQPYVLFRDSNASNARSRLRAINGGITFQGEEYISNTNPQGFVHVDQKGRVGFGTINPQRLIQIGPDPDPMFTIEASDASPRAGFEVSHASATQRVAEIIATMFGSNFSTRPIPAFTSDS